MRYGRYLSVVSWPVSNLGIPISKYVTREIEWGGDKGEQETDPYCLIGHYVLSCLSNVQI